MVTLAKRGGLHARRRALAMLHNNSTRTVKAVGSCSRKSLPERRSPWRLYTRNRKLGPRRDSAEMALIEWVDLIAADHPPSRKESNEKGFGETRRSCREYFRSWERIWRRRMAAIRPLLFRRIAPPVLRRNLGLASRAMTCSSRPRQSTAYQFARRSDKHGHRFAGKLLPNAALS
jgi:hypothetical protein